MKSIGFVIPSYNRLESVTKLVNSLSKLGDELYKEGKYFFNIYVYDQGYSPNEISDRLEGADHSFVMLSENGKYPKGTSIGTIMMDSIHEYTSVMSCEYTFLLDDDALFVHKEGSKEKFIELVESLNTFDVISGSKKLTKNLRIKEFPDSDASINMIPYKARFIAINTRVVNLFQLASSEMAEYFLGEDTYLFIKALVLGHSVGVATGADFFEIDHEMKGGLDSMAREENPTMGDNWLLKYKAMRPKGASQDLLSDFFHYDSAHGLGLRGRNDILQYISLNIDVDEDYNLIRVNGKQDMQNDGTARKMFKK